MNDYKVTATRSDGSEVSSNFTEPTEGAARKAFKECYRHDKYTITNVELIRERTQATKDQERKALAKIKEIVEGLGPDSYIATAFDGCFQDAETNIENDFGFSMKQRLESATFAEDGLREKLAAANARLEELGGLVGSLKDERSALEAKLAKQTLPEWLRFDLHALATEESITARKRMEESAEIMAEMADAPQDIAFVNAVESYRKAKERRNRCERLLTSMNEIHPED